MKSESLKELATALAKAQGEIKGALKDSANPFPINISYVLCIDVITAINAS